MQQIEEEGTEENEKFEVREEAVPELFKRFQEVEAPKNNGTLQRKQCNL